MKVCNKLISILVILLFTVGKLVLPINSLNTLNKLLTIFKEKIVSQKYFVTNLLANYFSDPIDPHDTQMTLCILDQIKNEESELIMNSFKELITKLKTYHKLQHHQCQFDKVILKKFIPVYTKFQKEVNNITYNYQKKCNKDLNKFEIAIDFQQKGVRPEFIFKLSYFMNLICNQISAFDYLFPSSLLRSHNYQDSIEENIFKFMVLITKKNIDLQNKSDLMNNALSNFIKKYVNSHEKLKDDVNNKNNVSENSNLILKDIENLKKPENSEDYKDIYEIIHKTRKLIDGRKDNMFYDKVKFILSIILACCLLIVIILELKKLTINKNDIETQTDNNITKWESA